MFKNFHYRKLGIVFFGLLSVCDHSCFPALDQAIVRNFFRQGRILLGSVSMESRPDEDRPGSQDRRGFVLMLNRYVELHRAVKHNFFVGFNEAAGRLERITDFVCPHPHYLDSVISECSQYIVALCDISTKTRILSERCEQCRRYCAEQGIAISIQGNRILEAIAQNHTFWEAIFYQAIDVFISLGMMEIGRDGVEGVFHMFEQELASPGGLDEVATETVVCFCNRLREVFAPTLRQVLAER